MFRFSNNSIKQMEGVDRRLIDVAHVALTISPVDFGIPKTGGLRTAEVQHSLFLEGASSLDGVKRKSKHQSGLALDVYAYVNHKVSYDYLHLSLVACAMLQAAASLGHKVSWGGLWGTISFPAQGLASLDGVDMPHFQLED